MGLFREFFLILLDRLRIDRPPIVLRGDTSVNVVSNGNRGHK